MAATKWTDKRLGFGLMRLPRVSGNEGEIDIEATKTLVDAFLANGFTYFDTAYAYAGSEEAFRKAVVERYPRESYTIASKLAGWMLKEGFGPKEMFEESCRRAGVDYFDYYLLHSLQFSRKNTYDQWDCWNFAKELKAQGRIRNLGFSYHGDPDFLKELLDAHPEVDFVQIQLNYVDWDSNAIYSGENYRILEERGIDVIVMEPNKGGYLSVLKPEIAGHLEAADPNATPSSFAMRYAADHPAVKMVLSGMNTMEQLEDNMASLREFRPLSEEEKKAIALVTRDLLDIPTVPCTACRYCTKGCPMGINIPEIFKAYNMILTFGEHARPHLYYSALLGVGSAKACECIGCGQCESVCPQHINIIEQLKAASAVLDV